MAQQTCPTCNGRGAVANGQNGAPQTCPTCDGTGTVSLGTDDLMFHYPLNPPQLTANQQGVLASVTIDNDSDFLLDRFVASSTGLFSVELVDRYTARPLQTGPIVMKSRSSGCISRSSSTFSIRRLPRTFPAKITQRCSTDFGWWLSWPAPRRAL